MAAVSSTGSGTNSSGNGPVHKGSTPTVEPSTTKGYYTAPDDPERWQSFIQRYAAGELHSFTFPTARSAKSSELAQTGSSQRTLQLHSPGLDEPGLDVDPQMNRQGSTENAPANSVRSPPSPSTPAPVDRLPTEPSRQAESGEPYADQSIGKSNQDPDIPDIGASNLPAEEEHAPLFNQDKVEDVRPQQDLTLQHVKQLNQDQKDAAAADREEREEKRRLSKSTHQEGEKGSGIVREQEDVGDPGPSSAAHRRYRRRPQDAELASRASERAYADSSPSDAEEEPERPPPPRPTRQRTARSRGSRRSRLSRDEAFPIESVLESNTGSSNISHADVEFDPAAEQDRVRDFFIKNGYLPAPRQGRDDTRRRLRVIRRLGLERPDERHRTVVDRFTRLAVSIFKTKCAVVSVIGKDEQIFLSQIGFGDAKSASFEESFCCHSILGGADSCMVVPNAAQDWRFAGNPFVQHGKGAMQFYAGAPLKVGTGPKAAVIGTMCVIDDQPRANFDEEGMRLLQDLAECSVSELELLYNQRSSVEFAKLHQVSVDFLRRSLKHRPNERAGKSSDASQEGGGYGSGIRGGAGLDPESQSSNSASSGQKRRTGADSLQDGSQIDIFDEACAEIRYALGADAVAIVDLSQFHLFYPNFSTSSTAGSTRTGTMTEATFRAGMPEPAGPRRAPGRSTPDPASTLSSDTPTGSSGTDGIPPPAARRSGTSNSMGPHSIQESNRTIRDEPEGYQRSHDGRAARSTYAVRDPLAPSITPQVLYIPTAMHKGGMTRMAKGSDKRRDNVPAADAVDRLSVLGYSSDMDAFAFDFTVTPASKRIIQEFIANHVKASLGLDRSVWYSRDDSEGIAQSITHLMPPGTETSLAMPVFSFDGQVAFAVVACWTDPLYSYPTGALQFIETIAGSLLASVMKEKLHQAERAQLNFAAAASHELRTPLHQINAAAALLRQTLQSALADSPVSSPPLAPQSESNGSMASDVPSSDVSSQSVYLDERFSVPQPRPAAKPLQAVPGTSRMPARILGAEDRADAMSQLEMIEANGLALGQILENIIDTLDIGRVSNMTEEGATAGFPGGLPGAQAANAAGGVDAGIPGATGAPDILGPMMLAKNDNAKGPQDGDESRVDLSRLLEEVVKQTIELENKSRRIAGRESLDKVEIVLEVAPRTRGQWLMATDPGPLIRALSKIIHNACKFTDKGYIHISMQDTTQDVVLPSGYDNSIKLSKVTIDVKDTGCGMTADFMDNKILQPFAKADPFMPGSGLGLSLARRMIDLLGGVLGIDSTYMKGTIVRINIPLHLYSSDNDSDQEEVANSQVRTDEMSRSTKPVRQDGVLLHGWKERGSATRRVGKAIMRQLRSRFCRLVDDPRYASLIVVPGELNNRAIADIANKAKPGVDIIVLNSADRSNIHHHHRRRLLTQDVGSTDTSAASASTSAASLPHVGSSNSLQSLGSSIRSQTGDLANLVPNLNASQVIRLSRPLFPSTIRRIMRPAGRAPNTVETYKSAVVGGQRATDERLAAAADEEASAARRRSLNDEMDVRAGIRDRESDYTDGESRAQVAPDGAVRNYRSNTATSTSYSISGDLSASEAAALRSLSISEDLSGAEAAAMQQHGLSRYMSRPSVGTGPAEASVGQRSVGYSTDGEVSHPQSMSRSHSQSQISTRPYDSTGWNNKSSSSIDRPHPEQSVQAENTDKASHADSAAEPDMQGQRQRASVDSVATSAEMLVGAEWSSSDGSQHDELSSPPSDGGDGDRVDESAEETGAEASRPAGGASRSPESAQRSEAGPLSPPLARRDDGDNDSRRGRTSLDGLAIENAASHFLPPLRPPMVEHATDPNPLSPIENEVAPSPIADKHQEADAAQRPSLKTTSSLPNVQDGENEPEPQILKVLVVEDNPVNRKIMVTMLKRAACHYAEAVDGNDAVQQFLAFSPHLVLLDINMPGKDGFEASTEMRKIESERGIGQVKKARIVAVTALSSEADKRRGMLECGIDEWKVKPVSMAQLRDDVKAMKIP